MRIIETNLQFGELNYGNTHSSIILHHSANSTMTVYDIHRCHKYENNWSGIGYHFFITKDGLIYRGRPENSIGAHCLKYNHSSLGICAQGNYMAEKMPNDQKQSIVNLCKYLCDKYNIKNINGHKELNSTDCPGTNYPLTDIKNSVLN